MLVLRLRYGDNGAVIRHRRSITKISRNKILIMLVSIALFYILLPQFNLFHNSLGLVLNVRIKYLILMIGLSLMTFVFAALTYFTLSIKRLSYPKTIMMQFASMLTSKLLPAGIGGIGLNYVYLRKYLHSKTEAASIVATNNFLGLVGHFLLLVFVLLLYRPPASDFHVDHSITSKHDLLIVCVLIIFAISAIVLYHYARKIRELFQGILAHTKLLMKHPLRIMFSLCSSICLTLCNVLCLYVASNAVHAHITFVHVLIAFTFGILVSSATPTPGGLGGMEAGLLATFISYHVNYPDAFATVILYRLISYWFTLMLGIIAFLFAEQNAYF